MLRLFVLTFAFFSAYSCPVTIEDTWDCITKRTGTPFLTETELLRTYAPNAGYIQKKVLHYLAMTCDANNDGLITLIDVKQSGCAKSCQHRMLVKNNFC